MKLKYLIISIIFFIPVFVFCKNTFVEGLSDVPAYKKMTNVKDSLVLFDKLDGRYVSSEIKGDYKEVEVRKFYGKVLPNLGWKEINKDLFRRDNEIMEIKYMNEENSLRLIFSVTPKK